MTVDAWTCPGCFALHSSCAVHWAHLDASERCMAATLSPGRLAAVCRCKHERVEPSDIGTKCGCEYRTRVLKSRRRSHRRRRRQA